MKTYFLFLVLLCSALVGYSDNLKLSTPVLYLENGKATAVFNLSWDNSWHTNKNHDAVWLFFKSIPANGQAYHINVLGDGHSKVADFSDVPVDLGFETAPDSVGLFVFPKSAFRGNINVTIKITLNHQNFESINNRNAAFRVFGIEMVNIPKQDFVLGDPDPSAQNYGSLYQPTSHKNTVSLCRLKSETSELKIGMDADLFYQKKEGYEGDQTGVVPAGFPKGVDAFYLMKYEITEGLYATFLNTLPNDWQDLRNITKEENYERDGGSITFIEQKFQTPYENKPCKFLGWEDAMTLADWSGLRPMTEFEFTKASRGNRKPIAGEFPWGTNNKYLMQRMPDANGVLQMNNGWEEDMLSDDNLAYFGASHYWVMDLSGSMWERVVSIGHPVGRLYTGSYGDGKLGSNGLATNTDWPTGDADAGGVGFRGGGFYGYNRAYHEFNPFSPIAYRPYGGWHGVNRNKAYGCRLAR
ncbi:SUMF1/EgtB/PvdO family nonheme iron enzyme [uncultured Psychroserpens sp.]|uniref:SUMF1/EgtB/PvdO family nonheme iron enzyme n=1 Tax=uncultured Psychroserpens sp. TaxID=255436 RepID=UPI0026269DAC|nr:SUMF1/EgtB/PvdO family nonheme iron enzyme [uncultured Psychroserpens sp.]